MQKNRQWFLTMSHPRYLLTPILLLNLHLLCRPNLTAYETA